LVRLSAERYSEFVAEIETVSGIDVDLRRFGTIVVDEAPPAAFATDCRTLRAPELADIEPGLRSSSANLQWWPEWSVDPRRLMTGLIAACHARGVEMMTGTAVSEIMVKNRRAVGVRSTRGEFSAESVINCAGAWAAEIDCGLAPLPSPTRPVKGQMLAFQAGESVRHVVRSTDVYLIPRTDGHLVVGATVEEAGFDKEVHPATIERLRTAAVALVPQLTTARVREAWAGLRPGSPDGLPILGETSLPGYFVASGHFRDGILLAPGTALVMERLLRGEARGADLTALSPGRFSNVPAEQSPR
jgi:glycine oxidase